MLKAQVIGHLGNDAVVNQVNGKSVCNFSVAHTENWIDQQGQKKERVVWVNCNYWAEKLGVAQYLKKGTKVYVEGQPEAKTYTTQKGDVLPQLTFRVSHIELLGSATNQSQANKGGGAPNQSTQDLHNSIGSHTTDFTNEPPF